MAFDDTRTHAPPAVLSVRIRRHDRGGHTILGGIALDVAPGETLALTGVSGIGKSTLMRLIAGLDRPTEGKVSAPDRIGMIFQEPTLLPWRSVADNMTLVAGADEPTVETALAEVGLSGHRRLFPGQLSLGQQRRLALARAFACRPDLLLMDEPFVSLDEETAAEMATLFCRLRDRSGVATILVTHAPAEAEALADRIVRLAGSPATVADIRAPGRAMPGRRHPADGVPAAERQEAGA